MEKIFKIYHLSNPVTNEIGYVGATTLELNVRLSQHKYDAVTKKSNKKVSEWFRSVLSQNITPKITFIESCTKDSWKEKEIYWINKFDNLKNTRKGGTGIVLDRSQESMQRSIDAHKKAVVLLDKKYNLIQEFDSCSECANYLNFGITAVTNALTNFSASVGGYIVLYKDKYYNNEYLKDYKGVHKDVYQYSLDGVFLNKFNSISEALNIVKPCKYSSGLHEAIERKGRCGNYFWSLEEIIDFNPYKIKLKYYHKN